LLAEALWRLLALAPERIDRLIVCPDAPLDQVSFAALALDDGRWLADACAISYIASGRALLEPKKPLAAHVGEPVIVAAPDYGHSGQPVWNVLKGSGLEGSYAAAACGVEPRRAKAATAQALLSVVSPRYLHIAGHGVHCESSMAVRRGIHRVLTRLASNHDPMERSALVMAVTDAAKAWSDDLKAAGIMTAAELCRLNMRGRELAVLSACDSGGGDSIPFDGTHGLRRALRAAGAASVVSSFWPVDDRTTPDFMRVLYVGLAGGAAPSRALAEASRNQRSKFREPRYWAPFFIHGAVG
jgi:CHAT domain-containing protein